ncbi:MAG: hypothetical protein H6724_07280 [Sandaracinus sp.]|nr:hypothetical protein [Sandaracinus sp.]
MKLASTTPGASIVIGAVLPPCSRYAESITTAAAFPEALRIVTFGVRK